MIYQIVIIILLIFALRYDINGKTRYRNECYLAMLVVFILIAGLRYRLGVDTTRYLTRFYYETPKLNELTWDDFELGSDPLYTLLNSVVLTLGGKFYMVQLLHAIFVNTLIFKYIKKHTDAIFISIFIFFIWQYALINMEEMRASMSLVVCLFANDYMLEKKWVKGLLLYVIGCLFHASTIIVMIMPMFFFLRLNKLGILVLLGAFFFSFVIQSYLSDYIALIEINDEIDAKAQSYADSENFMETNRNVFGYLSLIISCGYSVISLWYMKIGRFDTRLVKIEPQIMVYLIFAVMYIGLPIAYRFSRFYIVYNIMFVAEFMVYLFKKREPRIGQYIVYTKALIIMFPFFFLIYKGRSAEKTWVRYHPYSSIFDQNLDEKRERVYSFYEGDRPISGKY